MRPAPAPHPASQAALILPLALLGLSLMGANGCGTDADGDGWTNTGGDCNDGDADIHPEAGEVCDGVDGDCDGVVDNDIRCYPAAQPTALSFPTTAPGDDAWSAISPLALGWDEAGLDEVRRYVAQEKSTAFIMLYRGHIVMEAYWDGWDLHKTGTVYSTGKSVVAWLMGNAREDGRLALSDVAQTCLGEGWSAASGPQEAAITLRHLLTMTSGLDDDLAFEAPAGSEWYYNTNAYTTLQSCLAEVYGQSMNSLSRARLFVPIGMADAVWPEGETRLDASARDMARFGLLTLARGRWDGAVVLGDDAYIQAMLSPSQDLNPAYGYLWWLNGQDTYELPGSLLGEGPVLPTAPADLVAALGAGDKKIYVVPSMDLVVVRHGPASDASDEGQTAFDIALWERIMAAAP